MSSWDWVLLLVLEYPGWLMGYTKDDWQEQDCYLHLMNRIKWRTF
jgi:hypothetical protein